ncbi:XDD3 family exosortase-dependent surface protein [Leptolyngbya sp. PCC 6406]|uniref:XDD3 family exosortase-dependent surface protein n=1 Tax=Leptolyngbya sp. PCC 6406 TaxID=1173264 RepID=UPI0002ACBCC1|nr:XDD3 family exosortase-dependent surface protein [Leptolyngbya sp. PCC 6406]
MRFLTQTALLATGLTLTALSLGVAPGHAQTAEGWDYAIDSFTDGHDSNGKVGAQSRFEFYAMAIQATADSVFVAINSNLNPISGATDSRASNGVIKYGDFFFNFTGDNLTAANGDLFAVKFVENSDSGVTQLGLYGNVTGKNVAGQNAGFDHLNHHQNAVIKAGGSANMADLGQTDAYFGDGVNKKHTLVNSIASGDFLGGINLLDAAALSTLNFGSFGAVGTHTFGFSFDRNLLPDGDFIAHILAECINDGMAFVGKLPPRVEIPEDPESVPEPASALGLLALGGLAIATRRQRIA